MTITINQVRKYYKKRNTVEREVLKINKKKNNWIYGSYAINQQLPKYLQNPVGDIDFFTTKPQIQAEATENYLDKKFNGDYFKVKKAEHKGTYRVISNVTGSSVADFTKRPKKKPPMVKKNGFNLVSLLHIQGVLKKEVKKKNFRQKKDKEALTRIRLARSKKKK